MFWFVLTFKRCRKLSEVANEWCVLPMMELTVLIGPKALTLLIRPIQAAGICQLCHEFSVLGIGIKNFSLPSNIRVCVCVCVFVWTNYIPFSSIFLFFLLPQTKVELVRFGRWNEPTVVNYNCKLSAMKMAQWERMKKLFGSRLDPSIEMDDVS